jgi:hypothetical protein
MTREPQTAATVIGRGHGARSGMEAHRVAEGATHGRVAQALVGGPTLAALWRLLHARRQAGAPAVRDSHGRMGSKSAGDRDSFHLNVFTHSLCEVSLACAPPAPFSLMVTAAILTLKLFRLDHVRDEEVQHRGVQVSRIELDIAKHWTLPEQAISPTLDMATCGCGCGCGCGGSSCR